MKGKFNKETKIGILIILTIAVFIWGFSFLKGQRIFSPSTTYYVIFENVGGLIESSDIILSGYKIGHVDDIRFVDIDKMSVRLAIESRFRLPRGTVARIFSSDILSARAIQIVPGQSPEMHSPGDTLKGEIEPDFIEAISNYLVPLTSRAGDLMASMDSVMIILQSVLDADFRENFAGIVGNVNKTVISLQRSVYSADTLLTSEDSRLNRIIGNLESISGNLSASNEDISTILSNFASISDSLAQAELISTINHLNEVLSETALVMEKIEKGEGSLGKLISDENLYNNLESATESLDLLLIDIRDRPGRYLNFSVFGRRRD
jgi:phospholipid/cholesterol/gamma-HCH transport system substrate-binding protein